MASILSISSALFAAHPNYLRLENAQFLKANLSVVNFSLNRSLKLSRKMHLQNADCRFFPTHCVKSTITCSTAKPETLEAVVSTIANQLSVDETSVTPDTKFADLGADSLDTVEIMMALEEKFGVSIGEGGGAENVSTVQDAADLIEKVMAAN